MPQTHFENQPPRATTGIILNLKSTKIENAIIPPSLWRLAWPTTIANLLLASVGFIQILLSTQFGTEATAAVTVSQRIFFLLQASLFGLSAGVSAIIARNIGANEQERAGQAFQSALLFSFMLSMFLGNRQLCRSVFFRVSNIFLPAAQQIGVFGLSW